MAHAAAATLIFIVLYVDSNPISQRFVDVACNCSWNDPNLAGNRLNWSIVLGSQAYTFELRFSLTCAGSRYRAGRVLLSLHYPFSAARALTVLGAYFCIVLY